MKIYILPDQEYIKLPYEGINESLGVTDFDKNCAYIRKTGDTREDLDSLVHEVNEGVFANKWDKGKGNYYFKKWYQTGWGRFLPAVAGAILAPFTAGTSLAFLPGLVGAGIGGAAGYKRGGGALGTILGAAGGYGLGGLGAGISGALRGALGTYGGATTGLKGLLGGFKAGLRGYTAPLRGLLGSGMSLTQEALMGPGYGYQGAIPGAMGVGITPGLGAGLGATPMLGTMGLGTRGAVPWAERLLSPGALAGTGLLGLSTMGEMPTMPPVSEISPELYGQITSRILGTSPMAAAAREQLRGWIGGSPAEIMAGLGFGPGKEDPFLQRTITRINELKENQIEQINARAAQYGVFGGGWHREALIEAERKSAEDIAAAQKESTWRLQQIGLELKTSAVADALNLSMNEARQLMALLQPEIAREAGLYGARVSEQEELRRALGGLGGGLLGRALMPEQFGWLYELLRKGGGTT